MLKLGVMREIWDRFFDKFKHNKEISSFKKVADCTRNLETHIQSCQYDVVQSVESMPPDPNSADNYVYYEELFDWTAECNEKILSVRLASTISEYVHRGLSTEFITGPLESNRSVDPEQRRRT